MRQRKPGQHDPVVAVGQVEGTTIQVLEFPSAPGQYVWRIIKNEGQSVDSGMIKYPTIEAAMDAALKIVLPDAIAVEYEEPSDDDFLVLNASLFGFKRGDPLVTFQEAVIAHGFLVDAKNMLQAAKDKMPGDYEKIASAMAAQPGIDFELVNTVRSLQELALRSQDVMIELCQRDMDTLAAFIQHFIRL